MSTGVACDSAGPLGFDRTRAVGGGGICLTRSAGVAPAGERPGPRVAAARRGWLPPPFTAAPELGDTAGPVVTLRQQPAIDDGLPRGVRIAGAWAWRIILFIAAAYLLVRLVGVLRVVVIPVVVALLLAALFQPVAAALRRRGMERA